MTAEDSKRENEDSSPKRSLSQCTDFDGVLEVIGSQGKYQKFLLYVVLCPIIAFQPIFTLNGLFMLNEPDHWCKVPGRNNATSLEAWKNQTIPSETGMDGITHHSKCLMFDGNGSTTQCQFGWEYDTKDYESTIPSEFNWVCSKDHYATDALTSYALGNCVGSLLFGWGADKFGRKYIFFLTVFINTFFRLASLFVPASFITFLIIQFLIGTSFPIMYIAPSMIVAEISDKELRGKIYAWTWVIWVIGMASLPIIAWLSRNWFLIGLVTTFPGVFLFLYIRVLPESPRWLLSVNRVKEAGQVLRLVAHKNGNDAAISPLLESVLEKLAVQKDNDKEGVWTLFQKPRIARNTIMITISWSMNGLIYYGVTLNAPHMSGNQFVTFFILSIIEIPAGWLGGYLLDRTGRRWTPVAFFFACVASFIVAAAGVSFYANFTPLVTVSIFIAKFSITLTFLIVYLQGTEVFPTNLRSTGCGFAATVASAFGIAAPYIVFIGKYHAALPYLVLAILSVAGLLSSVFLPETLNQKLPETIIDANDFGKDVKFWSYLPGNGNLGGKKKMGQS